MTTQPPLREVIARHGLAARRALGQHFLLDANRAFHAHLDSIGYAHDYREFAGGHVWSYWDEHVQEALQFHLKSIALPKAPAATESRLP